ncbi:MAG TPA: Ig-like domain-containing protein [Frankiaceae bacterium]|nr:Ig-like domain-containing protein [Frankiaceae bacterium]
MLAVATLATGGLMTLSADAATPPAYAARASVVPGLYYIGDSAGSVYGFKVKNTGSTTSIGAVEINRPSTWSISGCPTAPAGWTATTSTTKCRYRSATTKSDDIKPGVTKTFGVKAKTDAGSTDRAGTWGVVVSSSNQFDTPSQLKTALSMGSGLTSRLHTFEVTTAVVETGVPVPGTACPSSNKSAIVGSTRTIVVCGRNHANVSLTPTSTYSTLGGTYIGTRGTFSSGPIVRDSGNVVLANWVGTTITSTYGTDHKVIAGVGSATNRTSPLRTFTGYGALSTPPDADNDAYNTGEDTPLTVAAPGVLLNDSDPDGDPLTAGDASDPANGSVTLDADGSFTYTPDANFHGTDSFTYTANDSYQDSAPATVTITVTPTADAPVATDDAAATTEDAATTIPVLGNDADADGDALSVSAVDTTGTSGVVTNNGVNITYDPNGMFEYLTTGQTATDTFTYTVSDGTLTDTATVTVTVTGVNDAPVATDDVATTSEDTPVVVNVLANDDDAEGPLTVTAVSGATNGTATNHGDGTVTFTPAANFSGTGTFTYTVTDSNGVTDTATVTVTVNGTPDAPVATDDTASTSEDASTVVPVLGNDADADGDALSVSAVDTTGTSGVVTNNGVNITYDPNGMFEYLTTGQTATDSFTYTVSDGTLTDTATVTVTVTGVNDAPVAADDTATTAEDTPVVVNVVANDADDEGPLTVTAVGNATNGTATNNNDGTVTFAPAANYAGPASFTYTVTDSNGVTDTATVTVTVNAVNDAPVANDDAANAGENAAAGTVDVLANDTDVEGSLSVSAVDTTGTSGVVTNNGTDVSYDPNGMFEYLAAGETATDTFTYTASDGTLTDTATVTVTITGANDAPVGNDDAYGTLENTPLTVPAPGVLTNDTDDDNGAVKTAGNESDPANGTVVLNANGSFTYTPDEAFTGTDTFTYDVTDGTATDSATVTITVTPPNATPTADATSESGNEDGGAITVTLSGSDPDGDALTFDAFTASNGLVTVPGAVSCSGATPNVCSTTVTYTPSPNFFGTDSFTYTVDDGTIDSAPATATITVNPVNDAPSFTKGANQSVNEDSGARSVTGWATAIAAGPANESAQALTFEVTTDDDTLFAVVPAVAPDGTLTFTPAANRNGSATVTVTLSDDGGTANGGVDSTPAQTFTITVGAVNDAPSFTKGPDQTVLEDSGAQSYSNWATAISKGPADESAQTLSFTTSNDNNALFSVQPGVSPTGTLVYTSAPNAVGSATVTITLSDTGGTANAGDDTSDAQTFTITVNPVNDAPSFTHAGNQSVLEDAGAQTVNGFVTSPSAGPADESGQTVTVSVTNVTNPTLFSAAPAIVNGTLTYTPAADANGSSTVSVRATDDGGTANGGVDTSPTQTFTITVGAVNDAPVFTKGANQILNEDAGAQSVSNWATGVTPGPANESGQTVSFTVTNDNNSLFVTQPAVSPTGTLNYTSAPNKYGTATVTIVLKDNGGTANGGNDTSAAQTFTITVNAVNDAPVAAAKNFTVHTNMKISLSGLLTGATDPNDVAGDASWTPSFTLGGITVGAGCVDCTVSNINNATGTFDFEPPAGGTGSYTLTYTVVDNGHPSPGATSAPQTITLTVSGPVIWFVNGTSGSDTNNGTLARPFATLGKAATVDAANHRIFVAPGTYADGITLNNGEWLTGAGAEAASFDNLMGITPPAGTVARPAVDGTNPIVQGSVVLGSNNVVRGLTLSGNPALSGTSFGTLTTGSNEVATTDVALSTTGQALSLSGGTIDGDFLSTTSSGGTNNVNLSTVATTGTTSLGTGALSGATSEGWRLNGSNGSFSYAGTVANATGTTVSVSAKTGGTVTFSGAVSDTAGAGVSLANNGGTTIAFTGGVNLTSGSSPAFGATGGGTVTVTGAGNTLASTTGTPLTVTDTTIGAADLTFLSISANGAARGIYLSNTGSSGNLVVTGNGGTCTLASTAGCSGGSLLNLVGADDSGATPGGTGVVLNNTRDVSLTRMRIADASNYGVRGTSVTNLTLNNVVVNGTNGTNAAGPHYEGGMLFDNLTGTAGFSAVEVTGGHSSNIEVNNTSGTLNSTFTNLRLGPNSTAEGNDGLQVEGTGTATVNVDVQTSTFTAARGDQFQYIGNGTGGGTLTFNGNTLTNSHPAIATGGGGVSLFAGAAGPVTMNVTNNTLTGAVGNAYTIAKNPGAGSIIGTFTGNTIGSAGVANSGSTSGSGMRNVNQGGGTNAWTIQNNSIRQYNNYGMILQSGDGVADSGTNRFAVSGNTLANPGTLNAGVWQGILVNSGVTPGDAFTTCVDFGANTVTGAGRNGGNDVRVRQRQSTTVRLPGYVGGAGDTAAVVSFVTAKLGGSPVVSATADHPTTGGGFVGTAC